MEPQIVPPPKPLVKPPKLIVHGPVPEKEFRKAKGYSKGEIVEAGLTVDEARKLGIHVDERRKTVHEINVNRLKEWVEKVKSGEILPPPVKPKTVKIKPQRRRVFRGLTSAGKKIRGLRKLKLRTTHRYKWKRKQKERVLKKRHEAARAKGGH